jgi:hypothetical protein
MALARKTCAKQVKSGHGICVDCSRVRVEHLAFSDVVHGAVAHISIFVDLAVAHAHKTASAVKAGAKAANACKQVKITDHFNIARLLATMN